ncbi:hypothetical protein Pan216_51910 [Planctomycetes bacterium Pan216]|uniref:Uncharacterized protein n=1 Tax=Kolteria novifilia TaxID=2527975 RepID=A0A518BBF7_9BACT|nr:hypothetical protein Pan216_51910 [Planctomycetes bacterium Pan216]
MRPSPSKPAKTARARQLLAWLTTREIREDWNAYLPWRNRLGAMLIVATIAGVCGVYGSSRAFLIMTFAVAIVVLGVVWPWMNARALRGTLSLDRRRATEGQTIVVTLTLTNRLPWPVHWIAVDLGGMQSKPIEETGDTERADTFIAVVGGRRTITTTWSMKAHRRGLFPRQTPRLRCAFPFGLWRASRPIAIERTALIWPKPAPAPPLPETWGERRTHGELLNDRVGTAGEMLGVRPYRMGDSLRRVHWGQTARHDRMIVCELQSTTVPFVRIVLDSQIRTMLDASLETTADELDHWERAIRLVAGIHDQAIARGAAVEILCGAQMISGSRHVAFDALAQLPDRTAPEDELTATPLQEPSIDIAFQYVVSIDGAPLANQVLGSHRANWRLLRADRQPTSTIGDHRERRDHRLEVPA